MDKEFQKFASGLKDARDVVTALWGSLPRAKEGANSKIAIQADLFVEMAATSIDMILEMIDDAGKCKVSFCCDKCDEESCAVKRNKFSNFVH